MNPALLLVLILGAAREGTVIQEVPGRAYLDRGSEDGLAPGMELVLSRDGRGAGRCRVEIVAPHHATCLGPARLGDRYPLPPMTSRPSPVLLPKPLPATELERRQEAVSAGPSPWVEDRASPESAQLARRLRIGVAVGHTTWTTFEGGNTAFDQERVDLSLTGLDLLGPFHLDASGAALYWSDQPPDARYRPGTAAMLLINDLEISTRGSGIPLVLSFGRVWPWYTPGVTLLDGAQAGWRSGDLELGAYGGGLPEPETLAPTFQAWSGGLYGSFTHAAPAGFLPFYRLDFRAGAVRTPPFGTRAEGEVAWLGTLVKRLDLDASLRVQAGDGSSGPSVGFARLELTGRPVDSLRFTGGFRFLDLEAARFELAQTFAVPAASRHADLAVAWDVSTYVSLSAVGGLAQDVSSGDSRTWVGPEITFPRALAGKGSLALGYLEEIGWLQGRSAWLQATYLPSDVFRLTTRASYYEDASNAGKDASETFHDVGLLVGIDARILLRVRLAGNVMVRTEVWPPADTIPAGLFGDVALKAAW